MIELSFPVKMYIKIKRALKNNDNYKTDVVWVKLELYLIIHVCYMWRWTEACGQRLDPKIIFHYLKWHWTHISNIVCLNE
jgi:hypothetical protein